MYKLMIVDDEPLTREFMKRNVSLLDPRWQVTQEAMEGSEALEKLKAEAVDLIITDIKMPVMDGLELTREVSNRYPDINIAILSGYEEFDFAKEAMRYGVRDYLLKPLVKDDLLKLLQAAADHIEQNRNRELALKAMESLSEESKEQVIKNFLKAVISEAYVEIKTIYPILFKLKVSLVEGEGVIMVLRINEDSLLVNSTKIGELSIFKLILSEISSEISGKLHNTRVFLDKYENTVILLDSDENTDYLKQCSELFSRISNEFTKKTGLCLSCGIGEPEDDVLQLDSSYHRAYHILEYGFLYGMNSLNSYSKINSEHPEHTAMVESINKIIRSIQSGLMDNNEMQYSLPLSKYVDCMEHFDTSALLRFGIYLVNSIRLNIPSLPPEKIDMAYSQLKSLCQPRKNALTKEDVLTIYKQVLQCIAEEPPASGDVINENDITAKAKNYIYTYYSTPLSLALLAEKISVSPSYLSSLFHKSIGESYVKFLTRVRMEEAAKLLRSKPDIKIYDVSEKVGYVSVKHFSYIFKNYFNITPSEYQEKNH